MKTQLSLPNLASFFLDVCKSIYYFFYWLYFSLFPYAIEEEGFQHLSLDLMRQLHHLISDNFYKHKILNQLFKKATKYDGNFEHFLFVCQKERDGSYLKRLALEKMAETAKPKREWQQVREMARQTHADHDILRKATAKVNRLELEEMTMGKKSLEEWIKVRDRAKELPDCEDICSLAMYNIKKEMFLETLANDQKCLY